jgi:NAD(P)-dependent dehydrogenase (short-subunit alcohol dehydrogenase family)
MSPPKRAPRSSCAKRRWNGALQHNGQRDRPGPFVANISGGRLRDPALRAPFEKFSPMRRLGEPDDIKGLALFLASPAAAFITGAQIVIDGGMTLGMAD